VAVQIDKLSRIEKQAIQRDLIQLGFLSSTLPNGDPADDGIWGSVTNAAYKAYWDSRPGTETSIPIVDPAPVKPWWTSKGIWGPILTLVSVAAGLAGYRFSAEEATDAIMPLVELIPLVLAAIGGIISWWGRVNAKNPIDKTLVAHIGGCDMRVGRMPVLSRIEPTDQDPRGHFRE